MKTSQRGVNLIGPARGPGKFTFIDLFAGIISKDQG
jgi:ABC-type branched-subunit amino acid transport system ATPase component